MTPKSVASISHLMSFFLKHCSVDISSIFLRLMLSLWFFFKTLILTSSREKWSLCVWVFCLLSSALSLSLWYETSLKAELVKRRISIKSNAESTFWWHDACHPRATFSPLKREFLQSVQTNTAFQEANKLRLGNLWYIIMQSWTATAADKGRKKP